MIQYFNFQGVLLSITSFHCVGFIVSSAILFPVIFSFKLLYLLTSTGEFCYCASHIMRTFLLGLIRILLSFICQQVALVARRLFKQRQLTLILKAVLLSPNVQKVGVLNYLSRTYNTVPKS